MIVMKSCPRCHGDMLEEELLGEVEVVCLQCGHRTYPESRRGGLCPQFAWRRRQHELGYVGYAHSLGAAPLKGSPTQPPTGRSDELPATSRCTSAVWIRP